MCETVHIHSNASIKLHDKLTVTNTSQQMFKVFAFGFDVRIKTISPLVNCLISDALLDSRPCYNRSLGTFAECLCV